MLENYLWTVESPIPSIVGGKEAGLKIHLTAYTQLFLILLR